MKFGVVFNYLYSSVGTGEGKIHVFMYNVSKHTAQLANLGEPHTSMLNGS